MILYFADRHLNILGQASTGLPKGVRITDDLKTEDVETGIAIFECDINYDKKTRLKVKEWAAVGNYILRSSDNEFEVYNIVETVADTKKQRISIYAEDDGLDLINDIAEAYEADQPYPISSYIERFAGGAGWEIGINEVEGLTRQLSWDSEQTASARLLKVAEAFNNCELSYSFDIKGLQIEKKYINIFEERGKDTGIQLRLNKEIDSIITTQSITNLATALKATGGTPDGSDEAVTLRGYSYDDGDFYIDGAVLKSRKALKKWSRYLWKGDDAQQSGGHIVKAYSSKTTSQAVLCEETIAELKKVCDAEINFEIDISKYPENVKIGDRVNIVDDAGDLYLSSRVLILETSASDDMRKAVLGEHIIKKSGISQTVAELAQQFSEIAQRRDFFTWIAYADDKFGGGISLDPTNKEYLGIATNKKVNVVDISDPSVFSWSKIKGEPGIQGEPGKDGLNIISVIPQYSRSSSSTIAPDTGWSEFIPEWVSGQYIWERQKVIWSDGSFSYSDPVLNSTLNHANEAAEYAQQQAQVAAESATTAERAAENAELEAQAAKAASEQAETLSQSASDKADQALSKANESKTAVELANADIERINSEVANVKENVASVTEEIKGEINTVKETMTADYAKKTELESTESSLKTEISKSVAELQTTMQTDYSKKTDLTDVQASLQTQITQNSTDIESTAKSVEDVKIDASNAQQKANEAKTAADNAQAAANTAKSEAEAAQSAAYTATTAAQNAQNEATAAQTAANNAVTAANNARAVAEAAENDLDDAKAELAAVTGRVDATEEDIVKATEAVATAQAAADQAKADVVRAENAATEAQNTANAARADAEAAQTAASTAQTDANNAKAAADKAQADADKALEDLLKLGDRVTTAETKITQNSEQIALKASKTEVTQTLGGYYTKSETDSKISTKADEINLSVNSKIDAVNVGGRNLLKDSRHILLMSNNGSLYPVTNELASENGREFRRYKRSSISSYPETMSLYSAIPATQITEHLLNKEITFSFLIRCSHTTTTSIMSVLYNGTSYNIANNSKTYPINTEWQRLSVTFTITQSHEYSESVIIRFNPLAIAIPSGEVENFYIDVCEWKCEKGNKSTDWTPAPEDVSSDINDAQTSADDALSNSTVNHAEIEILSESISQLVGSDENGYSLLRQTDTGFVFATGEIQADVAKAQAALAELTATLGSTEAVVTFLTTALNDVNTKLGYVNIGEYQSEPCVEVGKQDNEYKILITNTRILFRVGSAEPTEIDADGLKTDNITVKEEFRQTNEAVSGFYVWAMDEEGYLSLYWKDGD